MERAGLMGKIVVTGLSAPNDMKEFAKPRGTDLSAAVSQSRDSRIGCGMP